LDIEEAQNINKEIDAIKTGFKPDANANLPYPIEKLDSEKFEILLYLLFKDELRSDLYNFNYDNTYLLKYVKDRGRDVTLFLEGKCVANIQCKRYNSPITKNNLIKEVLKFILYSILDETLIGKENGFEYIFATTDNLTDPAQSLIEDFGNNIKNEPDIESLIQTVMKAKAFSKLKFEEIKEEILDKASKLDFIHLGKKDINQLIRKDDEVKSTFFQLEKVANKEMVEEVFKKFMPYKSILKNLTPPPFLPLTRRLRTHGLVNQ